MVEGITGCLILFTAALDLPTGRHGHHGFYPGQVKSLFFDHGPDALQALNIRLRIQSSFGLGPAGQDESFVFIHSECMYRDTDHVSRNTDCENRSGSVLEALCYFLTIHFKPILWDLGLLDLCHIE